MARYTENSVLWTHTLKMGPMVQSRTMPDAGPGLASNGFAYACEDDTLSIPGLYGLLHSEATCTRRRE